MRPLLPALLFAISLAPGAAGAQVSTADLPITDAAPVVVTGVQPGPGLWRVSKDGHVMHVLGTVSPLPRGMEWRSRDVLDVLAQAQEVLTGPSLQVTSGTGFFGTLALMPSMIGLRDNPDDRTLKDVVPAPSYARWTVLKARYMPNKRGVEDWRPMFAAMELYDQALDSSGLARKGVVWPQIQKTIDAGKLKVTKAEIKVTMEKPRAAIKEFKGTSMDDIECFDSTLRRLETDLPMMAQRANAWAIGDIDALRALPAENNEMTCMQTAMRLDLMRRQGLGDADSRLEALWLDKAQDVLARNERSFAVLPMEQVLGANGYLAKLAARGYSIEAP